MEMESARNKDLQLKDIIHVEHQPLVFCEDKRRVIRCEACQYPFFGERYSCQKCEYHLHKHCAEAPLRIYHHPFHSNCEKEFLTLFTQVRNDKRCDLCLMVCTIFYGCQSCGLLIDAYCALASLNGVHKKFEFHPHKLVLIQNNIDKLVLIKGSCDLCGKLLFGSIYICEDRRCREAFHKKCAESPEIISHPCHRKSFLHLSRLPSRGATTCDICLEHDHKIKYYYGCSSCDIWIHVFCFLDRISPVIEDKQHHEHPFNLFWRQHPFICDACGNEGRDVVSYVCVLCQITVHKKCISLPRFMKHTRHLHPISHHYFDVKSFAANKDCRTYKDCRICYKDVKTAHGSYSCLKEDCDYIVHVHCAIEDEDLYNEIDEKEARELIEKGEVPLESCITCVIKKNELGEAVEIKHSFHEHPLLFQEKSKEDEDDDKQCDGCVQSIYTSFFYCRRCNFFLDKSCANLSKTMNHWRTPVPFTLEFDDLFKCKDCRRLCSGFCYNNVKESLCIPCATITDTFENPANQDFLFVDDKRGSRSTCGGCYERNAATYRSKSNGYGLCVSCMTLPRKAKHKFDRHVLDLSYHDKDKYEAKNYCDICEEKRGPDLWFYHCSICDTSAHPRCVLGGYPWIKSGSISASKYDDDDDDDKHVIKEYEPIRTKNVDKHYDHRNSLTFVRKIYLYPECSICEEPCLDLSVECTKCNDFTHYRCD